MKRSRFFTAVPAALSLLAGLMFALVLGLIVLCQPAWEAYYQNRSLLSNLALWPMALAAIALLFWARARWDARAAVDGRLWALRAFFAAVLAVQFIVARCAWYKMGWDVANVYTTAEDLARGLGVANPAYFDLCPNNAPLTLLQVLPLWAGVRMGLGVPFVVLPYLDAVLLNLAAYLSVRCVQLLSRSRVARGFALILSTGWIALSPYILYPYTDTFSIVFPVLALYLWLRMRRPVLKWFLISLVSFFGASIKPTALIFFIALILVSLCRLLARPAFDAAFFRRVAALAAAVLVGMLPCRLWQDAATAYLAGSATPQGQLSETHYLMLGMNGDTYGGHSGEDVAFSRSFATLEARREANLARAWERFVQKGVLGNLRFFAVKAYKAYADGTFAAHSSFLDMEIPRREDALSTFVRSLYHRRGNYNQLCCTIAQWAWLGVLTLCAYAAVARRGRPAVALLSLTLIGLTAYLLLFEVWPRYLFLYAPFFVILSSLALEGKKP